MRRRHAESAGALRGSFGSTPPGTIVSYFVGARATRCTLITCTVATSANTARHRSDEPLEHRRPVPVGGTTGPPLHVREERLDP